MEKVGLGNLSVSKALAPGLCPACLSSTLTGPCRVVWIRKAGLALARAGRSARAGGSGSQLKRK